VLRRRFWPKPKGWLDYDNLLEQSSYWPKPKGRWPNTFLREQDKLVRLETQFYGMVDKYYNLLIH